LVDVGNVVPVEEQLARQLTDCSVRMDPFGGTTKRITLVLDTDDAIQAGNKALELLRCAISEYTTSVPFVDEIKLVVQVDPIWASKGWTPPTP
jgi:hypothetical protein